MQVNLSNFLQESINLLCPINSKVQSISMPSPWLVALLSFILTLHESYASALRKNRKLFY